MSNEIDTQKKNHKQPRRWKAVVAGCLSVIISIACFTLIAKLHWKEGSFIKSPLRGALTGLGSLGVAYPLFAIGFKLKKRSAGSPYFEEAFIAGVINLFGFACMVTALVCLGLSANALIQRLLESGK
jgi:hypothetical protein